MNDTTVIEIVNEYMKLTPDERCEFWELFTNNVKNSEEVSEK